MEGIPKINFFTAERMQEFWGYVWMLMSTVNPAIMLVISLMAVGMLITVVINAFKQSAKEKDDDDDDFEVRHY